MLDDLAHGAERGAAIRRECGEVLGHGESCHVGDDTRCGSWARTLRQRWWQPTLRPDGDVLGREAGHRIWEFREAVSCESSAWDARDRRKSDEGRSE